MLMEDCDDPYSTEQVIELTSSLRKANRGKYIQEKGTSLEIQNDKKSQDKYIFR